MVSRAAFYRYYQDKYDLVEQIFEEAMNTMMRELDQVRRKVIGGVHPPPLLRLDTNTYQHLINEEYPPAPWVSIFEHFAEYEHLYRALLGEKGSSWFGKKMRNYFASLLVERVEGLVFNQNATPLADQRVFQEGFVPMLVAGQILDTICWWLEHDRLYPPKQIAEYCHRLIIASLREVNTWG
jgi:AcrR family transcriptional regulator